jgi:hypothetical protein
MPNATVASGRIIWIAARALSCPVCAATSLSSQPAMGEGGGAFPAR